ncbi:carbonic anhydrase 7-like [Copidosoma floridanum]|uniref:carbonic anhydrase 7-like n=1 Tax=Copidosoma floridanum TaxID=29053 RepID=UPI0006C9C158|nr:carbonic anhydrase 7-like [Copidosoma floridanum]
MPSPTRRRFSCPCKLVLSSVVLVLSSTLLLADDHIGFDYKTPGKWPKHFPACGGARQSPINIDLQQVQSPAVGRPQLRSSGHEARPLKMTIVNNGHSVQLSGEWKPQDAPAIFGGPLIGVYEFAQLHFHWGKGNDNGSEHTVANHSYPLEMHMVYWKKAYKTIVEALKHDDGAAVVGYLLSLDKNANVGIERIRSSFPNILYPGQKTEIDPFPLSLFDIDVLKEGYVSYLGSLTTPPCSESVTWLLSVRVKKVTIDEMESFRRLKLNNDDVHNFRPTQPLNSRIINYHLDNQP